MSSEPRRRSRIGALALLTLLLPTQVHADAPAAQPPASEQIIGNEQLAEQLAAESGLDALEILHRIDAAAFDATIVARMDRQPESLSYTRYRPNFINPARIERGKDFLATYRPIFDGAEARYGVPAEVVAAILGVETFYGRSNGKYRVLDALYTLATGYPRRADFFRKELGEFLLLCREEGLEPTEIGGSIAGAFGMGQFMPSSFRKWAVDSDGDGKRDIRNSPADAIHSVAHYLAEHGWQPHAPVLFAFTPLSPGGASELWRPSGPALPTPMAAFRDTLPDPLEQWSDELLATLLPMQVAKEEKFLLFSDNFRVVMTYNRSTNYALAVSELAIALGCQLCGRGL